MAGRKKVKPSVSIYEEKKINHNGDTRIDHDTDDTNIAEDFENRPLKKPKCAESSGMDDPLPSPTISASSLISECYESSVTKLNDQTNIEPLPTPSSPTKSTLSQIMEHDVYTTTTEDFANRPLEKAEFYESSVPSQPANDEPLPSPPTPIKPTLSPVSEVSELNSEETVSEAYDDKQPDESKYIINNVIYDYLPQDYTITVDDECALDVIRESKEEEILVKIEDIEVKQKYLMCLLHKDKWLDDEVISAYICCLKEQAHTQNPNDAKVYFENPFVTRMFKRDGEIGVEGRSSMTDIVNNYLNHDMIHLPINIKNSHWYLASVNFELSEIQVLDSLCWEHNRDDLTVTLQGLQYHLDILNNQENLSNHKWKDIDVTKWAITEQLEKPIQTDSSSCGLFMLKFMEYWTGHTLSHLITQKIISSFRYKLAAILLCWKNNTPPPSIVFEEIDDSEGRPDDVIMSDKPFDQNQSNNNNSLSAENKYQSLISILSSMSIHELVGGLCNYIKSINREEILEKVWVQSPDPYPVSLTLRNLQEILNDELPMDRNCFNLLVRKIMFDDIQTMKKRRGSISKHYLDTQFWMITDFARHPNHRKKIDVEQLAYSVRSWPGIKYNVSSCQSIHIPIQSGRDFILFILDKDTRTVYILDPTPVDPTYQRNPHAKYLHRLLWIAEHLPKAMSKACPGSVWNENILLWQQNIVHDISGHKSELSGFFVTLFMSTWDDGKVHLPFLKDENELRKFSVGQLITLKENECEKNMPTGVLDFISCIRKIQSNMM